MIKEQRKYEYIKIYFLIRNIQSLKLKRKITEESVEFKV